MQEKMYILERKKQQGERGMPHMVPLLIDKQKGQLRTDCGCPIEYMGKDDLGRRVYEVNLGQDYPFSSRAKTRGVAVLPTYITLTPVLHLPRPTRYLLGNESALSHKDESVKIRPATENQMKKVRQDRHIVIMTNLEGYRRAKHFYR